MALECTLLVELEPAVSFTCADTAIPKGSLMILTDPNTVAITTGDTDEIIGIAAEEYTSGSGLLKIGVYLRGIFRGFAGLAGVTAGKGIISDTGTGAANEIVDADNDSERIIGTSFETATDTQSFRFLLNPISFELA